MRVTGRGVFQRSCLFALRAGLVAAAVAASVQSLDAQQLVTDAPVAKTGGTAYVGKYTPTSVFSAGPAFHFNSPVVITSLAYDSGPGGVKELGIRSFSGCSYNTVTSAGTVCSIETEIASKFPGWRYGTLRVTTTSGVFTIPVEWQSIGAQVAVTPGTVSMTKGAGSVKSNAIAVDALGNVYTSGADAIIRKIDPSTGRLSIIAGSLNGSGTPSNSGDGGPAVDASIQSPVNVVASPAGDVYILSSQPGNGIIRKVDGATGTITTVTGPAASGAMAVDGQGNIYTTGQHNSALIVTSGDAKSTKYLVGGDPNQIAASCNASFAQPVLSLAVSGGNVYFSTDGAVYKISADTSVCNAPSLVAGTGTIGSSGDGGLAVRASIGEVSGLAVDAAGDVYLADATNQTVRMVSAATGIISTVAGAGNSLPGVTVAGGYASLALDVRGNIYVLDANGVVQTIDVSAGALSFAETGQAKSVVFTNSGNDTLVNASPSMTAGFVLDSASTCGVGNATQLAAGESCVAAVDFNSPAAGVQKGTLSFGDASIVLNGNTTDSATTTLKISPADIDFGNVSMNEASRSWTVSVANTGTSPLSVSNLILNDTKNFELSSNCGGSLPAHSSCDLTVTFKPQAPGAVTASIFLTGNANPSTQTVSLKGQAMKGGYSVAVAPGALTVERGQAASAQFVFAPTGGFAGAVNFTCAGLPAGTTCSFAPAALVADGSDVRQSSVLTVSMRAALHTTAPVSAKGITMASLAGVGGLMLFALRRKRGLAMTLMLLLGLVSLGATGCGDSTAGMSSLADKTMVTVVATSAADGTSQTAMFELTVK